MSRLVALRTVVRGEADATSSASTSIGDKAKEYGERVAKYVPAEVLAFYTAALQLIATKGGAEHHLLRLGLFTLFGLIALIATPLWVRQFSDVPEERRVNGSVAFVAFAVWAYAYPTGFFFEMGWYDPLAASLILLTFTFISARIVPTRIVEPAGSGVQPTPTPEPKVA